MRSLLVFIFIICSYDAFSQNFPTKLELLRNDFDRSQFIEDDLEFHMDYPINFELVSSNLICPQSTGIISCKAIGTQVVVKATLKGCLDSLTAFDADYYMYDNKLVIEIDAKGLHNPDSDAVRCVKMPDVKKLISVPFEDFDSIQIINLNTLQ